MPTSRINKLELLGFGGFQDLENSSEVPGQMKKERVYVGFYVCLEINITLNIVGRGCGPVHFKQNKST
jgi:hypothetical protein